VGVRLNRIEILDITPRQRAPGHVRAEGGRAAQRAAILTSEGQQQAAINSAQGRKQAAVLEAEGAKQAVILQAEPSASRSSSRPPVRRRPASCAVKASSWH